MYVCTYEWHFFVLYLYKNSIFQKYKILMIICLLFPFQLADVPNNAFFLFFSFAKFYKTLLLPSLYATRCVTLTEIYFRVMSLLFFSFHMLQAYNISKTIGNCKNTINILFWSLLLEYTSIIRFINVSQI